MEGTIMPFVYLCRMEGDGELFDKVGRTVSVANRMNTLRASSKAHYKIKSAWWKEVDSIEDSIEFERKILVNQTSYSPKHKFDGSTECIEPSNTPKKWKWIWRKGLSFNGKKLPSPKPVRKTLEQTDCAKQVHDNPELFHYISVEGGAQYLRSLKPRAFINSLTRKKKVDIKNQVESIQPIIQNNTFFWSNIIILEFDSNQISKKQFVKIFNPLRAQNGGARLSFLISEESGKTQVIIFLKSPAGSPKRLREKLLKIEKRLGVHIEEQPHIKVYCLQSSFEQYNVGIKRDLERCSL